MNIFLQLVATCVIAIFWVLVLGNWSRMIDVGDWPATLIVQTLYALFFVGCLVWVWS